MPDDTTFTPHGRHLIAGDWVAGPATFANAPTHGPVHDFAMGTPELVDLACTAAEDAFWSYGSASRADRAAFLNAIADEIEARADAIIRIGSRETGLPEARLQGERGRTTGQLRLFADHILKGAHLDRRHDGALPDRAPLPRPDLKMVQRPIGPVAVFGASNFPLAFSTAGGDTAAALAAGCPVVVKGHPAHPGTAEIIAEAVLAAITATGMHPGTFSMIHDGGTAVGKALVEHPLIRAVGFTGSLRGGRALFDLCAARPEPIPFFGELGSINPVFLLPHALRARGAAIGQGWAASLTMGAGQFCTNPGIAVLLDDPDAADFVETAKAGLAATGAQTTLTGAIANAFRDGCAHVSGVPGVEAIITSASDRRSATPHLYQTDGATWLANPALHDEVFGPLGLIVRVRDAAEMLAVARSLGGQLTCTLQMEPGDTDLAARLMPVLERKAGRILANGFPTGVEVADAMVHGGPYPASTNFGATSVGTLSIRRFLRPVCYQDMPDDILPADLR